MPGTSFPGIDFPAFNRSIEMLDDIKLVTDDKTSSEYKKLAKTKNDTEVAVHWDDPAIEQNLKDFGRTTKAGVAVALRKIKEGQEIKKKFLVIAYDRADRYDPKK